MEQDIFIPDWITGVTDLDKRYAQFKHILTEDACSAHVEILKNARTTFMEEQAEDLDEAKKESFLSNEENRPVNK